MSEAYALDPEDDTEDQPAPFDLMAAIQSPNLAFDLDDSILAQMGAKVVEEYQIDEDSRKASGWDEKYQAAMDLAMLVAEEKSFPWPKASNVKHPLIATAAIQFNARARGAIIDGPMPVKGSVRGSDRGRPQMGPDGQPIQGPDGQPVWEVKPGAKRERADRIGSHMSYQLMEEIPGWVEDTDRLLIKLPVVGCAFRKSWFDPVRGCNRSSTVSAKDFVVNYWTESLESCPRGTHVLTLYPHEVTERKRAKLWLDVDLGRPAEAANDDQAPYTFYEQFRLWDLDDDGYPEPYTITVEKVSAKVVRVRARFDERGVTQAKDGTIVRIEPEQSFTKYPFIPAMDGSYYDIGFGMLLSSTSQSINTALNQMFDAATLANLGGGWIGGGISIKSGVMSRRPGEWKRADGGVGPLRDNILPMPTQEPSAVLFQLLVFLLDGAKDLTATQDILGGDAGKGTLPVGTVSALIEQGLKTFTAIVGRIHNALKNELAILYRLNGRYLDPEAYYTYQDQEGVVAQDDYKAGDCDVVPVSDPNMATDMQRTTKAQAVIEIAKECGGDMREAGLGALEAFRFENPEKIFPKPQGPPPEDPRLVKVKLDAADDAKRTDIEAGKADILAAKTSSDMAYTDAQTEQIKAQLALLGPEAEAAADQLAMMAVARALERAHGGQPAQVQQGDIPRMDQQPPHPGVPGAPEGAAGDAGGPMGPGGGVGAQVPGQGPPPDGVLDSQLV